MHASRIRATLHRCLWAQARSAFKRNPSTIPMTTAYFSLGLRKRPFSFSEGLAAVFDHGSLSDTYHVSATPQIADAHAIASDFIATGSDMRTALSDYLLLNDKPIESLATFIVALGSAFGPKIYSDFIQPKQPEPPAPSSPPERRG